MSVTPAELLAAAAVGLAIGRAVARIRIGPGGSSQAERDMVAATEAVFSEDTLAVDVASGGDVAWATSRPERWAEPPSYYEDPFRGSARNRADDESLKRSAKPLRIAVLGDSISHGVQARIVPRPDCCWVQLVARVLERPADPPAINTPPTLVNAPLSVESLVLEVSLCGLLRGGWKTLVQAWQGRRADAASAATGHAGTMLAISGATPATLRSRPVPTSPLLARLAWWLLRLPNGATCARWIEASVMGAPPRENDPVTSPLRQLERATEDAAVDLLFVAIGANCALRGFLTLKPRWRRDVSRASAGNVWLPTLFDQEMRAVFGAVANLVETGRVRRVVVATIPHVVVAPAVRGFGERDGDGYFEVYRWLTQERAKWGSGALGQSAARRIDRTIDYFNARLQQEVLERRAAGRAWLLFDINWTLNRVAARRNEGRSAGPGLTPYDPPPALALPPDDAAQRTQPLRAMTPEYANAPAGKLERGGLVSLDGVHPSGAGYALLAREALRTLDRAGVPEAPTPDAIDTALFGEDGVAIERRDEDPVWSPKADKPIADPRAFRVVRHILGVGDLTAGVVRAVATQLRR